MTYLVHKNQVEFKSTVLQRFNSKFSEAIHIRIERQVATNKNITSKTFFRYGLQTEELYSSLGLIYVTYSLFPCPEIVGFWPAGFAESCFLWANFSKIVGFAGRI